MIKNYFKIALRNLTRQKLFSLINVSGLAIGLAVCMVIMLYVEHEHSYDGFHKNADRIVTLRANIVRNGDMETSEYFSDATAPALKDEVPVVENYAASFKYFLPFVVNNVTTPQSKFNEDNLLYVDAGFFKFFSFKLIAGQPGNVLSKPFSVVISRDMAKKYFGDSNPIGKILAIKTDGTYNYQVTGIAENNPSNSSIQFNFVASSSSLKQIKSPFPFLGGQPKLGGGVFNVFLLLKHPADTAKVLNSIMSMIKRHPILPGRAKISFSLPLITDIHLNTRIANDSNIKYLKTFPVVAILILLLALFNYMSLSTARSTLRAKEVGVRKISGASRKTLAVQFYTESAIFTLVSFILGYLLCYLFKPWFLNVLQLRIDNAFLYSPLALTLLAALLVLTVLVAGFYPALALSAFKPVVTLKGKMSKQAAGAAIRKIFTTLQFAISIALIICGIIIDRQLYFFRHTNSGMDRNNIVMLAIPGDFGKKYQPLKKDIGSLAGVSGVATSNYTLFRMYDWTDYKGTSGDSSVRMYWQAVDRNFISTLGLKWKFAPAPGTNLGNPNAGAIINEAAVEKFNLGENPVGRFLPPANGSDKSKIQVAGVLKDFNFQSMQFAIAPFALYVVPDTVTWSMPGCVLYAKIKPHTNLPSLMASMQTIYKKYDQNTPLGYSFVDEVFDAQYKAEDRLASIFSVFTGITILLAALGLFGLAAFTIEQRTKEIGIRKILGASLSTIGIMLSKDFLKLVLLAIVIASPIAWYFMNNWLQDFAFRITIQFWMFGVAGLLAVMVAVLTIGYHAFKAAIANPADSLRSE